MKNAKLLEAPEYINNAGLVLLAPWFPMLFARLGFLNSERKDFKDLELRIRAIFILQRLATDEDKEYKEPELAFSRILVECPFYEPLPANIELTDNELLTIESLLKGVMRNWEKMWNASTKGIQHNFIKRNGHIEQKEDKWLLTVDQRAHDIFLDSLPWSYNKVSFPWLTMPIQVSWRQGQTF